MEFPATVVSSGGRYRFHDDQQTPDTHLANYEFPGGKQITWQGLSCNKHADSTGLKVAALFVMVPYFNERNEYQRAYNFITSPPPTADEASPPARGRSWQ